MHLHAVLRKVESDVCHVQEIVSEVLFDYVAPITQAYDEVVDAVMAVQLHDVPQDRTAPDLDHGFRAQDRFLTQAGTQTARQDHRFHRPSRSSRDSVCTT